MKKNKTKQWTRLDNAAKIFPPTTDEKDTKVFRFACELKEEIQQKKLAQALKLTLEVFPFFRSVIRKGLFWYYLEISEEEPVVCEEYRPPCSSLYDQNKKKLLFEVTYFRRRINLEVYHALTDGTGAMQFLRTLVCYYLGIVHKDELEEENIQIDYDASIIQKNDDSFSRYYEKGKKFTAKKISESPSYLFKGARLKENRMKIMEGRVSVKEVLGKAHEYHTTLTVFLTALIMCSIADGMTVREKKHQVVITIPVNLRKYFESESARNFFGVFNVGYDFQKESGKLEDVITQVDKYFKERLTSEQLERRMQSLGALEHNIFTRITPLVIKDFFMKIGYQIEDRKFTISLSNIGNVKMPEILQPYIHLFSVFNSTAKQQICMCSFGDILTMSFTSSFLNAEVQKNFFRRLSDMGISVTLATNGPWEE